MGIKVYLALSNSSSGSYVVNWLTQLGQNVVCVSRAFVETRIDDVDSFDWSSDALAHFNQVRVNISMIVNKSIERYVMLS